MQVQTTRELLEVADTLRDGQGTPVLVSYLVQAIATQNASGVL